MSSKKPVPVPLGTIPRVSYAQNQEDILLDRLFRGEVGTFMDVGAHHPMLDSNTYFFYLRGWRGVNLEPLDRFHALLKEHRPEDLNLAVAASDVEGTLSFFEVSGSGGLSTLSAEVAERHRAEGLEITEYEVPVRTIGSLIREHGIEPPDLLCIDVETCEDRVIRGIPLESWRPRVLVIESTIPMTNTPCHQSWEPILLAHGYLFTTDNGINRFYLREDLGDRLECFRLPVNVLDNYRRYEVVYFEGRIQELLQRLDNQTQRLEQTVAERQRDQAHFAEIRAAWEQERAAVAQERVAWAAALQALETSREQQCAAEAVAREEREAARQQEHAARQQERASWQQALEHNQQEHAARQQERASWQQALEHNQRLLAQTQLQLRPYRLLDRLGVVTTAHGWARGIKHRLVPARNGQP